MSATQDRPPMTEKQAAIYEFIREFYVANGFPPTIRRTGAEFGISSPNGIRLHCLALVRKGYLRELRMGRSGPSRRRDGSPGGFSYAPTDAELVVQDNGERVLVQMSGPGVEFTREGWADWLRDELGKVIATGVPEAVRESRTHPATDRI